VQLGKFFQALFLEACIVGDYASVLLKIAFLDHEENHALCSSK
jgi:hypothetical protein